MLFFFGQSGLKRSVKQTGGEEIKSNFVCLTLACCYYASDLRGVLPRPSFLENLPRTVGEGGVGMTMAPLPTRGWGSLGQAISLFGLTDEFFIKAELCMVASILVPVASPVCPNFPSVFLHLLSCSVMSITAAVVVVPDF